MITLTTSPQEVGIASDGGFRVRLLAWYSDKSGNTATVHVKEEVTFIDSNYAYYYGTNKNYTLNFNGTSSAQYADTMSLNSPVDMAERTQGGVTGGSTISASASWYSYNYGTINCGLKDTVQLPTFGPSGLNRTNVIPGTDNFKATVSVSAWNGGSAANRYRSLSVCADQSTTNRRVTYEYGDALSSQITTDNNSTQSGSLTIQPNTRYYLHSTATNGSASVEDGYTAAVTLAEKPTITIESTTADSATLGYSTTADGGFYDKIIEWSEDDGSTWNTAATITGGNAAQGTFTITGLTTGEHTVLVRTRTASGTDGNVELTLNLAAVRLISSDGTTGRESTRVLVPVDGVATEASRLLVSHNGVATENA